jgi:hypothetical protein
MRWLLILLSILILFLGAKAQHIVSTYERFGRIELALIVGAVILLFGILWRELYRFIWKRHWALRVTVLPLAMLLTLILLTPFILSVWSLHPYYGARFLARHEEVFGTARVYAGPLFSFDSSDNRQVIQECPIGFGFYHLTTLCWPDSAKREATFKRASDRSIICGTEGMGGAKDDWREEPITVGCD